MLNNNRRCLPNVQSKLIILVLLLVLFICLLPIINYSYFADSIKTNNILFKIAFAFVPVSLVAFCYQIEIGLSGSDKNRLFMILVFISLLLVDIHIVYIDIPSHLSSQYWMSITNAEWQSVMHYQIMTSNPERIPYVYRFLPNSIVSLMTFFTDDFEYSKMMYRESFMFLLLFSIYYYGKIYYNHAVALVTVLFYAVVYPISIREYAGQLVDPMSHLSFVLAFIFIELDIFLYLFCTIMIGIMAKETIILMSVYYLLKKILKRQPVYKALFLLACGVTMVFGIRYMIVHDFKMNKVTDDSMSFIVNANLSQFSRWWRQILFTVGIFVPFVTLSWRQSERQVKYLVLFLLPILLMIHSMISSLTETRNLVPVVIPMALLTANYLLTSLREEKIT